jgi:hypothetical protein
MAIKLSGHRQPMPMKYETNELKKPFIENGYHLDDVFYCSESVLNKQYRGLIFEFVFLNKERLMLKIWAASNISPSVA